MATVYGNLFGSTTLNTSVGDRGSVSLHGRVRRAWATATIPVGGTGGTQADVVRMLTLRSNDRIHEVLLRIPAANGGAGAADIGYYFAGQDHNGIIADGDLHASAQALTGTVALVTCFVESTNLTVYDKGKTLWALLEKGALSYTVDPRLSFDLAFTITTTVTVGAVEASLIVDYTAG